MNFKDKINSSKDEINFVEKIDRIRQGISDRKNEDSDTVSRSVRNRNRSENRCNILIIRNELAKKSNDLTIIRKTFVAHAQNHRVVTLHEWKNVSNLPYRFDNENNPSK